MSSKNGNGKQQPPAGDDSNLDELAVEINRAHEAGEKAALIALKQYHRAGVLLSKAKALVRAQSGHGHWLDWLKASCPRITARTAQRYMAWADGWDGESDVTSDLDLIERWRQISGNSDVYHETEEECEDQDEEEGNEPVIFRPRTFIGSSPACASHEIVVRSYPPAVPPPWQEVSHQEMERRTFLRDLEWLRAHHAWLRSCEEFAALWSAIDDLLGPA
jgi:hypothetical protein